MSSELVTRSGKRLSAPVETTLACSVCEERYALKPRSFMPCPCTVCMNRCKKCSTCALCGAVTDKSVCSGVGPQGACPRCQEGLCFRCCANADSVLCDDDGDTFCMRCGRADYARYFSDCSGRDDASCDEDVRRWHAAGAPTNVYAYAYSSEEDEKADSSSSSASDSE